MSIFKKGSRIKILEKSSDKVIDEATVESVNDNSITVRGKKYPEETVFFGFVKETESWYMLFEGLRGETCFNSNFPYVLFPI